MGFLLSAEFAIPAKETAEIITADKNDIIFLIFPLSLILSNLIKGVINKKINQYLSLIHI